MTQQEFQSEMARLVEQFKGSYSQARTELIWREVRDQSPGWWKKAVDTLLGDCRQAPLLPEVRTLVGVEREKRHQGQNRAQSWQAPTNAVCRTCSDTGVIRALHKGLGMGPYAFKCNCQAGRRDGRKFPQWEHADRTAFEVYA